MNGMSGVMGDEMEEMDGKQKRWMVLVVGRNDGG